MPSVTVVGAQWGDEGKAGIVDLLSEDAAWVVRFQGGPNAGHTVVAGGESGPGFRVRHADPGDRVSLQVDHRVADARGDFTDDQGHPDQLRPHGNARVFGPVHPVLPAFRQR